MAGTVLMCLIHVEMMWKLKYRSSCKRPHRFMMKDVHVLFVRLLAYSDLASSHLFICVFFARGRNISFFLVFFSVTKWSTWRTPHACLLISRRVKYGRPTAAGMNGFRLAWRLNASCGYASFQMVWNQMISFGELWKCPWGSAVYDL